MPFVLFFVLFEVFLGNGRRFAMPTNNAFQTLFADICNQRRISGGGRHLGEGEAHRTARLTLEGAMYGSGVVDEVAPRPGVAHEELDRQHVRLEAIALRTGGNDVARHVGASLGQWMHVIQRRMLVIERRGAVHAAAATVAKRGQLDLALLLRREETPHASHDAAG